MIDKEKEYRKEKKRREIVIEEMRQRIRKENKIQSN